MSNQNEVLEQQKLNCPFCKIIKGDIPSKKIFDDNELVEALLDINPATEGHALIMPKEHYPILPLIPPDVFKKLFTVAVKIADVEKLVLLKQGTTIFVANGGAAGQQSSHFMIHVIARDTTQQEQFNLFEKDVDSEKLQSVYGTLSHNLPIMLKQEYNRFPLLDEKGSPLPLKQKYSVEQVIKIIEQNAQLKDALIAQPNEFKKAIPQNGQLNEIFADVDVNKVIRHFIPNYVETEDAEFVEEKEKEKVEENKVKEKTESKPKNEVEEKKDSPPEAPKPDKSDKANLDDISRLFG